MVKSVAEEPEVTVTKWGLVRLKGETYHLTGIHSDNGRGRISTPIVSFDHAAKTVVTSSGRVYRLQGPPDYLTAAGIVYAFAWAHIDVDEKDFETVSIADVMLALEPPPTMGMN